ncbi:MAG: hypothetical protein AAF490_03995 [Chloroflexota bacterium]
MEKRFLWTAVLLFLVTLIAACSAAQSEPAVEEEAASDGDAASTDEIAAEPTDTPEPEIVISSLANMGPAPEIENEIWLNTDEPIPLASVEGKVVLLEFWTFG